MSDNWSQVASQAAAAPTTKRFPTIEELKSLSILYVLERAGVEFEEVGGVYKSKSPFRADNNPSFDVFGENLERWGDFSEGTGGDVLDLLSRFYEEKNGQKPDMGVLKDAAAVMLADQRATGWVTPPAPQRAEFDLVAAKSYVESVQGQDPQEAYLAVHHFLESRNDQLQHLPAEWLVDKFRIGWDGDRMLIPYYNAAGALAVYKTRRPGSPVFAASGASYPILYGAWLDDGSKTVVLCEGESDVWSGTHAAPDGYVFLGLPTGAGSKPRQASQLSGRRIILALDGDPAGREATTKWTAALLEHGADVMAGYVPDGMDLSKMSADDVKLMLETAMPARIAPAEAPVVMNGNAGYERANMNPKAPPFQVSDWVFEPHHVLIGDDGYVWEGALLPSGKIVTLRAADLGQKSKITLWSQQNGCAWFGGDRDAQLLVSYLYSQSTNIPRGRAVSVAGLHGDMIVYPGGKIGNANYVYVPGKVEVPLGSMIHMEEARGAQHFAGLPLRLRELHTKAVMDPILAWMALAPLRSKLEAFPILAVTGAAGSGKTTLIREVTRHMSASKITANLTGTTKFAMLAYVGSTNAFPVWFDEYRPGARKETLAEFNQLLRDAYTGQASIKGGMGESWGAVREVAVNAPMIVSGEDAFTETSHTERMVTVHLPKGGQNTELMPKVEEAAMSNFAFLYMDWVRHIEPPTIVPEGPSQLKSRNRYNLGALRAGWELLRSFLDEHGLDIGAPPDWSLVVAEALESGATSPILEALSWALEDTQLREQHVVFEDSGLIHVRVVPLVSAVNRTGVFTLPGGHRAVAKYLQSQLGATNSQFRVPSMVHGDGAKLRTWSFPAELLDSGV